MLSKKALEDFKRIWKEEFGEEPSDEVAVEQATKLLTLMNAVYRPVKKEWVKEYLQKHPDLKVSDKKVALAEGVPPKRKE